MYISRIELTDIRCLGSVVFDLQSRAATNKSLMLLGDNGVGKSTILRSIAIGICDRAGAGALLSDLYGDLIREGAEDGSINITLKKGKKEYCITTLVTKSAAGLEEIRKEPEDFDWNKVFVCGYGANRGMHGNNAYDEYSIADAVYTLFNYEWPLWSPELVIHRRIRKAKNPDEEERRICDQLADMARVIKNVPLGLT